MIYSNMLKPKFRNLVRAFVLFLVAIFSLSLYSCQTTWVESHSPDILRIDDDVKILNVRTINDSLIDLADCDATYSPQFDESKDVILWSRTDTIFIKKEPSKEFRLKDEISKINLNDIFSVKVEKTKTNVPLTILLASGILAAAVLLWYSIALLSAKDALRHIFHDY